MVTEKCSRLLGVSVAIFLMLAALGAGVVVWLRHESEQPQYTHFPLRDGAQQALLACAAGYARLDVTSDYPPVPIEWEADQAANVNATFRPLAVYAADGLRTSAVARAFEAFCKANHMWP
jgi:NAD(P)-dependent dehydrogenase (short-subunit alcohol dehydrogenase family)